MNELFLKIINMSISASWLIPAHFAAGTICFQQTVPAAKSENPILSVRSSTENVGGLFLSYPSQQKGGHSL